MVHKVGLLPACNHQQVPFAYKMFTSTTDLGWAQSTLFKKAFSMDVDIEFIGVWDTVCSVGLIPRRLPFTTNNTAIKTFRHAISLDERRAKFKANHYNRPNKVEQGLGTQPGEMPHPGQTEDEGYYGVLEREEEQEAGQKAKPTHASGTSTGTDAKTRGSLLSRVSGTSKHSGGHHKQRRMERQFSEQETQLETDVLEVWFSGCHCGAYLSRTCG